MKCIRSKVWLPIMVLLFVVPTLSQQPDEVKEVSADHPGFQCTLKLALPYVFSGAVRTSLKGECKSLSGPVDQWDLTLTLRSWRHGALEEDVSREIHGTLSDEGDGMKMTWDHPTHFLETGCHDGKWQAEMRLRATYETGERVIVVQTNSTRKKTIVCQQSFAQMSLDNTYVQQLFIDLKKVWSDSLRQRSEPCFKLACPRQIRSTVGSDVVNSWFPKQLVGLKEYSSGNMKLPQFRRYRILSFALVPCSNANLLS